MGLITEVPLLNDQNYDLISSGSKVVVEFRNTLDLTIRVRSVGIFLNSNLVVDLKENETYRYSSFATGERVVMAWDAVTNNLLFVGRYNIANNGRIKITDIFSAQTRAVSSFDMFELQTPEAI